MQNASEAYDVAQEDAYVFMEQIFMLCSKILVEEARLSWN